MSGDGQAPLWVLIDVLMALGVAVTIVLVVQTGRLYRHHRRLEGRRTRPPGVAHVSRQSEQERWRWGPTGAARPVRCR